MTKPFADMTVAELKKIMKENGIPGRSLVRAGLISAVTNHFANNVNEPTRESVAEKLASMNKGKARKFRKQLWNDGQRALAAMPAARAA